MPIPFNFSLLRTPALMGIVNVTPNSFSDIGQHFEPAAAIEYARSLANQGAQIIDLGAEASSFFRPGVEPVPDDEQLRRLTPVLAVVAKIPNIFISIDTRSAVVAKANLAQGAHIINDISAGTHDPAMLETVAQANGGGAAIILMHIGPTYPDNPPQDDSDILATVTTCLAARIAAATRAGIPPNQIAIDPGLGFGKTPNDNWTLALRAHELQSALGLPFVLGASRKRFLESSPPTNLLPPDKWQALLASATQQIETRKSKIENHPRDPATAALTRLAITRGIPIHRLHNITLTSQAASL